MIVNGATLGLKSNNQSVVFHYRAEGHELEHRGFLPSQVALDDSGMLIVFSAAHWRESWKYGVRGWRYSVLDVGHAIAAISVSATAHGWQSELLTDDGILADMSVVDRDPTLCTETPQNFIVNTTQHKPASFC